MKDAIDKRNERERIARSIVKRRNIIYTSREELERKEEEKKTEDRAKVEELVKQLKKEEDKKQAMEIEKLLAEQQALEQQLKTGMDATGKKPMDDIMQEKVEAILSEKSRQLQDIIIANSVEVVQENKEVEVSVLENSSADESKTETIIMEEDIKEEPEIQTDIMQEASSIPEEAIKEESETDMIEK